VTFGDMRITQREQETLEQCYSSLDELQATEVEQEAFELATEQLFSPQAAAMLLELLVKIVVRNVRERGGE